MDCSPRVCKLSLSGCCEVDEENAVCRRQEMLLLREHVMSARQREMAGYLET
jgi:hypothetical protein